MITFILCVLTGGFIASKLPAADKIERALFILVGLFVGAFVGIGISKIASTIIPHTTQHHEREKAQLIALGDSSKLQGSFFLATGSFDTEQYYTFYYKTADGGKQFGKISVNNATVYEEARSDAYMAKTEERDVYSENAHLWLILNCQISKPQERYAIHVPKGTIQAEYKLDLK